MFKRIAAILHRRYALSGSDRFVKYLRGKGISIGQNVTFYDPASTLIDLTRPYLITIGNKVKVTRGVIMLTHGFEWCVLRELHKRPFGSAGRLIIGDNVFIGMNSIILKGTVIGNNVIIGAGSVVASDVADNSVVAGNPAKKICSIDEYYEKAISRELSEACEKVKAIRARFRRHPVPEDFREFFYLFVHRDRTNFGSLPVERQVGDFMAEFLDSEPRFKSFDDFLRYCDQS